MAASATCVHQGGIQQPQVRELILEASFRVEPAHLLVHTCALQPKHILQGAVPGACTREQAPWSLDSLELRVTSFTSAEILHSST